MWYATKERTVVSEMADQLTKALSSVIGNPSFRRDAARFLSLPKGAVDRLTELVESHGTFDVPASDVLKYEQECDLEGHGRQVLAAARLIRLAVQSLERNHDRRQNLADFAALVHVRQFHHDDFSRFFSPLPKLDSEELEKVAIAVAPTVVGSQLYSDLRVISHGPVAPTRARRAGFAKGTITYMAPDFDAPLDLVPYQTESSITSSKSHQRRLTGPVQFLIILLKTWRLSRADAIPLLGFEKVDQSYVEDLLSGRATLRGRDLKYRIAYLFRIRKTLYALFRDEEVENEWLREQHDMLDGRIPMDCMLEGSMENLLLVKEYVAAAAGR